MGYGIVSGEINLDNYCGLGIQQSISHFWSFERQTGKRFDITASQFEHHLSRDNKLPRLPIWLNGKFPIYVEHEVDIDPSEVW